MKIKTPATPQEQYKNTICKILDQMAENATLIDEKKEQEIFGGSGKYKHFKTYNDALEKIELFEKKGLGNLPICVAKTQYSFSDNAKLVGAPKDFEIYVRDVRLYNGAGFITVLMGTTIKMPGLPKVPNYEKIYLDDDNEIVGLS